MVMKGFVFLDITPCSPLKVNLCFGGTYRFHIQGRRISQTSNQHSLGSMTDSSHYSTLKMEVTCCFKILVDIQRTTPYYIPEGEFI
jgi:hypothetical protein